MRKAVVSPISLVLIVAIVLALIAAAYIWGLPLIEKRVSLANYVTAENFVKRLDKAITDMVSAGGGKQELPIPMGSVLAVPYDSTSPENNSITLDFILPQPLALDRSTIYLGSVSFMDIDKEVGVYGQSRAGLMWLRTEKFMDDHRYRIALRYRELETTSAPEKGYKIALRAGKASGSTSVMVSFGQTEVLAGKAANGGDLTVTYVDINVY